MPFSAARNRSPEVALASSMASRVSFVNLQKFTLAPCDEPRSIMMFAPAQKIRSFSDATMTVRTSGCSKRRPWTAPPEAAAQRRSARVDPGRHPEERRRRVPAPRLSRGYRRADCRGAAHEKGKSLLLLRQQGRDPLRLPPVLARSADEAAP